MEWNKHILKISNGEEIEVATSIEKDVWKVVDANSGLQLSVTSDLFDISLLEYIYGDRVNFICLENTEENLLKIAKDKIERIVKAPRKTVEERLASLRNKEDK